MNSIELPVDYRKITQLERRYVREEYSRRQGGKCSFCGENLTEAPRKDIVDKQIDSKLFPPNFFKHPVHLHHCHRSGMTIGACHSRCNAVLWQHHGE